MSTTTHDATTVVEYGVRYTWPDGHSEIDPHGSRYSAEFKVRARNHNHAETGEGGTAELVTREITTTAWEVTR